jgi:hypothetical protein
MFCLQRQEETIAKIGFVFSQAIRSLMGCPLGPARPKGAVPTSGFVCIYLQAEYRLKNWLRFCPTMLAFTTRRRFKAKKRRMQIRTIVGQNNYPAGLGQWDRLPGRSAAGPTGGLSHSVGHLPVGAGPRGHPVTERRGLSHLRLRADLFRWLKRALHSRRVEDAPVYVTRAVS